MLSIIIFSLAKCISMGPLALFSVYCSPTPNHNYLLFSSNGTVFWSLSQAHWLEWALNSKSQSILYASTWEGKKTMLNLVHTLLTSSAIVLATELGLLFLWQILKFRCKYFLSLLVSFHIETDKLHLLWMLTNVMYYTLDLVIVLN